MRAAGSQYDCNYAIPRNPVTQRTHNWNAKQFGPASRGGIASAGCLVPNAARGSVLIITMWIVIVLTGLVLVLARAMRVEGACSANVAAQAQAQAIEQGAIQYVLEHVDSLQGQTPTAADMPCGAVRVGSGAFWIIRPNFDDDHTQAFGLVDEASKLNLNTVGANALSLLPQMTPDMAASVLIWRGATGSTTAGGADDNYYLMLSDPYQCKKGSFETVEELLLVKDITRDILYGEDANRNGILDANEDDGDASDPTDNRNGQLDRGLADFVTVYSSDQNVSSSGRPRANINTIPRNQFNQLPVTFPRTRLQQIAGSIWPSSGGRPSRRQSFLNVFDFFRVCRITNGDEQNQLADLLTTESQSGPVKGLINVNTAPREVLIAMGLSDADAVALIDKRADGSTLQSSIGWVYQTLKDRAIPIANRITTKSYQFSADIISVSGNGRAFRRCRIIVDATKSPPQVIYRQDLTSLGWPLDEQILDKLRAGASLDQVAPVNQTITSPITSHS